jgi:hypothetical protein
MKKEVLIAIFVGLSMGLIITFGVYRVKSSLTDKPVAEFIDETQNDQAVATPTILALHSPEDGLIQTETELTITGATIANSFIVIFINDEDYITTSDETGNFTLKVELDEGENFIRVHVLDENSATVVEERFVMVSDAFEKLEAAQAELDAKSATDSATEDQGEN